MFARRWWSWVTYFGAVVCGALALPGATAFGSILYVDDDAPLGGNGQSWRAAFRYLQDAFWVAGAGDEIRVAGGLYKPDGDEAGKVKPGDREASFRLTTTLTLAGSYAGLADPANPDRRDPQRYETVLSGDLKGDDRPGFINIDDNSYHVVRIGYDEDQPIILDRLTITAGNAPAHWTEGGGGIAYFAIGGCPAILRYCRLVRNHSAGTGGGASVLARFGSAAINLTAEQCTFAENGALLDGGALALLIRAQAVVRQCTFTGNQADFGGAASISTYGDDFWRDCQFRGNHASQGGALFVTARGAAIITCEFESNTALNQGGAVYNVSSLTALNCRFLGNRAGSHGGALCSEIDNPLLERYDVNLFGSEFSGNTATTDAGAVFHQVLTRPSSFRVISTSMGTNSAAASTGGIHASGLVQFQLANTVLWANRDASGTGEDAQLSVAPSGTLSIGYSCVQGWTGKFGGVGNIGKDPRFLDPLGPDGIPGTPDDDLRLDHRSPCIDAADNTAVPPDTYDLDGDGNTSEPLPLDLADYERFRDDPYTPDTGKGMPPIVDMGAYEFRPLGDLNCDGAVNNFDIDAFVLALTDPAGYKARYPDCDIANADVNGDHAVNNFDIDPFVRLLTRP